MKTRTIDKKEFKYAKTEMFTTMQNCEGGFRRERLEKRKIGLRPRGEGGEGGILSKGEC